MVEQARRVLERHVSARIALALLIGIPAAGAITRGYLVLGVVALVAVAALIAALMWATPARQLARMVRHAHAALPPADAPATLVGTVVSTTMPLVAPHSGEPCVAYWQRSLMEIDGTWSTAAESTAAVDFVLRCGDILVSVEAAAARILFDAAQATRRTADDGHGATEEAAVRPGDRIVVSGRLVHGPDDGPFRAAARLTPDGDRGLVLGLMRQLG